MTARAAAAAAVAAVSMPSAARSQLYVHENNRVCNETTREAGGTFRVSGTVRPAMCSVASKICSC